jgi:DNA repair protein RadA/Sms
MAKEKNYYYCSSCGYKSTKWQGKCPECGEWNSFSDEIKQSSNINLSEATVMKLEDIKLGENYRYTTGVEEFDRVLGGGAVRGEAILVTGNPGIGKSTILLQMLEKYTKYGDVLYISGEESVEQVKFRSSRIGIKNNKFFVMSETEVNMINGYINSKKPCAVVVDSIQTVYNSEYDSISGTVTQIRECTLKLIETAKKQGILFFIVGHVTKDGKIAGPKMLEHMVDAVLSFEGEEDYQYRILRSTKNRYGSTNEVGIFNMSEEGITEVKNPSEFFLSDREEKNAGSIIVPIIEGSKTFLLEVQALATPVVFGMPRRVVQGADYNRVQIIAAIIEKKLSINIGSMDIFINIPGGIAIKETAGDLALAMAIISAVKGVEISRKIAAVGELGLMGEVRKVSFIDKRIKELEKVGFTGVYLPESLKKDIDKNGYNIKINYLKNLNELFERMS